MTRYPWLLRCAVSGAIGVAMSIPAVAGVISWTTGGPPGDALSVIADSRTAGLLYAGSSTGLFRSTDNGASWVSAGLQGLNPTPLATGAPGTVFATSNYGYFAEARLYRSLDAGETWMTFPLESNTFFDLSVDPFIPTTLYRVNRTSVGEFVPPGITFLRSTDAGSTWIQIELPFQASYVGKPVTDPFSQGTLYLTAYRPPLAPTIPGFSRIYESIDSGSTWTILTNSDPAAP